MKIRIDYVSNSSSSSFVLATMDAFEYFNVTKQDIMDALVDAYGKEKYEARVKEKIEWMERNPDAYDASEKEDPGPIWVYDLSNENDKNRAIARWGDLLKQWKATNAKKDKDGFVDVGTSGYEAFNGLLESIYDIYRIPRYELELMAESQEKSSSSTIDPTIVNFIQKAYVDAGMMTNLEAVKCNLSRFFVHADDNEIWGPPMAEDDESKWSAEPYSYDRVCEVILNHLIKVGKIKPTDPKFLEYMRVDNEFLSPYDIKNGYVYDFANGKDLTWHDLKRNSLTWCMHEG